MASHRRKPQRHCPFAGAGTIVGECQYLGKDCMSFKETDKKIDPCTLIISLLDEQKNPVASWECQRAVPHKWKLDDLNAESSGLAIESITLKHTKLK